MTQEEKAKAYDEAIRKLRGMLPIWKRLSYNGKTFLQDLIYIFPELTENKDEEIRKEILEYFQQFENEELRGVNISDWIAWLEKQREKKSIDDLTQQEAMDIAVAKCFEQGEQKPTFKVGDWITDGYIHCKISDVLDDRYIVDTKFAKRSAIPFKLENNYHLWSIEDAKDGDVLVSELSDSIILFKCIEDNNIQFYCDYDFSEIDVPGDRFAVNDSGQHYGSVEDSKDIYPATKEQRDILFQKMHEAGYTFDFEKKELKKLKFRVGDEIITENEESLTITRIDEEGYWSNDLFICDFDSECSWDLVGQKPYGQKKECEDCQFNYAEECKGSCSMKRGEQKPAAWSEEDERHLNTTISYLKDAKEFKKTAENCIDWLITIKQRIGE